MHTLQQLLAGELTGATRLKISEGLTTLPPEILELADTLEQLDLTGNQLSSLPSEFSRLQRLKILFLSDNRFTTYPEVLGQCPNLEMVGFKANRIERVPEKALSEKLRWLILTDNQLTGLPETIGNCRRLQKLMLAGNRLKTLPTQLAQCTSLELLRLSANQLQEIPDWLFTLPRLAWLALAGNPVTQPKTSPAPVPEIPWNELTLFEQLGEGASGTIYRATWRRADQQKDVAVKLFKGAVTSDGWPADEMNASLLAGTHPNLVGVLGKLAAHPAHQQGLVMALIPAGFRNLGGPPSFATCTRDTFAPGTTFPFPVILKIAFGAAAAAAHLHQRGLLHGDLYAHNMLLNAQAELLFGDFGAATIYDPAAKNGTLFEKVEVRAFGYLLEDLTNHANSGEGTAELREALAQLKDQCLQPELARRPVFAEILETLAKFRASLAM